MPTLLRISPLEGRLYHEARRFDPRALAWEPADRTPGDLAPIAPAAAVRWLFREGGGRGVPVAVIGPKRAGAEQVAVAEELGRRLGDLRVPVLCGGKSGVMEAVCRGCHEMGGVSIGLVPDDEWTAANPYVTYPLATGLGPARNAVIARAAFALIAVGGEYGTLSEMAFGMHFDRLVLSLADAPEVPGAIRCAGIDEALERMSLRLLGLDRPGADPAGPMS